jgi:hypothetical protein
MLLLLGVANSAGDAVLMTAHPPDTMPPLLLLVFAASKSKIVT